MTAQKITYHIIGAGVAGLNAAVYLQKKHPQAQVIVYEATAHAGGRAISHEMPAWGLKVDNATHVLLGANHKSLEICGKDYPNCDIRFWNVEHSEFEKNWLNCRKEIAEAVFNTSVSSIGFQQWLTIAKQLFPFTPSCFKAGFSKGDLGETLINPLISQVKDIRYGWKLTGFTANNNRIQELEFGDRLVFPQPQDKIISALDSYHYSQMFNFENFEYNTIINIFFRTSMQLTLPGGCRILGLTQGTAQWLFSSPGLLAVTISNSNSLKLKDDELAHLIWKEICQIRGRAAAFMPEYKVLRYKRATIKQDKINNDKRPVSAQTTWFNLQICGDWTMKNYPCCVETALRSALRLK